MVEINFSDLETEENIGVLIVDMQIPFVNEIHDDKKEEEMVEFQELILKKSREKNWPVCLIETENKGITIPEISENINKGDNYILCSKNKNSAFSNTYVDRFFKNKNISKLIIMGLNASLCIKDTVFDAKKNKYIIYTSSRLMADYGSLNRNLSQDFYNENSIIIDFSEIPEK